MKVISSRRGAPFTGFFLLLFFLFLLFLVTGWFLARTEGARTLIAQRLSDRLGVTVSIAESRIVWPYVLELREVASADFPEAGVPGFSAGSIRIGRGWRYWNLECRHLTVRVQRDHLGLWTPLALARLADLREPSAVDITRLTTPLQRHLRLRVSEGVLVWLDEDGAEEALLRDVGFRMEPVRLPDDRLMIYYDLKVYAAAGGALGNARDLHWAWLTSVDKVYIELERSARYGAAFGRDPEAWPSEEDYVE